MTAPADAPYQLSIDIGGTFTDLVLRDSESGAIWIGKVLTTPAEPSEGVYTGVVELLDRAGVSAKQLKGVLHATTLATNAVIERKGAKTGLLTTAGFRDTLELRDESRYDLFDLFLEHPRPLVPRQLRLEVDERVLADGSVDHALDLEAARATILELGAAGVEAVAICLLHSYRNPDHEQALGALVAELLPDVEISLSHEVAPEIREFPRTATTVTNVYIKRIMTRYLRQLHGRLESLGLAGDLFVMLSSGSLCDIETASQFPVRLIESGPAAGALAATAYGRASGHDQLISFDMGGTTAKACLVDGGQPARSDQFEVDRVWRFKPGSGTPLRTPVIELIEIGAGGGSIASIDALGLLRVGPESAGADPGPACYGRGGTWPTVTDADLVLGFLDRSSFLGGRMTLDRDAAVQAIDTAIAQPLGIDVLQAAWGIHRMVNESMAGAARMAAAERGNDPRDYPIFAFGGAGPVHAFGVGSILGSRTILMPMRAGVMSAVGLLCAPLAFDFVHSWVKLLDEVEWDEVAGLSSEMERAGRQILARARVDAASIEIARAVDMRYHGQGYEITVPVPGDGISAESASTIAAAFETAYERRYGRALSDVPAEVVNWRLSATSPVEELIFSNTNGGKVAAASAQSGERPIYVAELGEMATVPVFDRYLMSPGTTASGPAIVEENESTLVVGGSASIVVDEYENLIVTLEEGAS